MFSVQLGLRSVAITAAVFVSLAVTPAAASVRVPLSGWNWGNPAPQGNDLRAIDFLGGRGYAVGSAGTALRTDDAGATWSGLATGTAADLARLQIVDPETIVVLSADGCVLRRSDDGGRTFRKIFIVAEVDCPDRVQSLNFVDRTTGYLLLRDGSVLRTTDAGQSFSKQTAIPGTQASATPGGVVARDLMFNSADTGFAFVSPAAGGPSAAYFTTDAGVSWKALPVPAAASVDRLYRFDAKTIYGVGSETLLRSVDGGLTFTKQAFGAGLTITSIGCADALTCLLTTSKGELDRTTDGGETATTITASSVPLAGAAFAAPGRAVAVGAAGQTVVSDDAGINYVPIGGDVGGQFSIVRRGPVAGSAFAPGAKGQVALTLDGGVSWKVANVATSADIADTSWASVKIGYALDVRGGLFRTLNGGLTWQTLSAGPGAPARAVLAVPGGTTVLLFGPRGVKRSVGGGEFAAVAGAVVAKAALSDAQLAGSAIFAWRSFGGRQLLASTTGGRSWRAVKLPSKKTRIRQVSFLHRSAGFVLDGSGRVWRTGNGGRTWTESLSAGSNRASGISLGSATSGYLSIGGFGADTTNAYVLHTSDAGRSWRPQAISVGQIGASGIVAADATHAFALLRNGQGSRGLFFTATGGDAGAASPLRIKATPSRFDRKSFRSTRGKVTITGTLGGAVGGEQITVSARLLDGATWTNRTVTAGANGGSFSATFNVKGSAVFVAQWAGDSGRVGEGTAPLVVRVKR